MDANDQEKPGVKIMSAGFEISTHRQIDISLIKFSEGFTLRESVESQIVNIYRPGGILEYFVLCILKKERTSFRSVILFKQNTVTL